MDFIFELLVDLLFGLTEETAKSKRLNKYVNILAILFLIIFYLLVITVIFIVGILMAKDSIWLCLLFVGLGILFLILS